MSGEGRVASGESGGALPLALSRKRAGGRGAGIEMVEDGGGVGMARFTYLMGALVTPVAEAMERGAEAFEAEAGDGSGEAARHKSAPYNEGSEA